MSPPAARPPLRLDFRSASCSKVFTSAISDPRDGTWPAILSSPWWWEKHHMWFPVEAGLERVNSGGRGGGWRDGVVWMEEVMQQSAMCFSLCKWKSANGNLWSGRWPVLLLASKRPCVALQVLFIDYCFTSLSWLEIQTSRQNSLSAGNMLRRSASVCALAD